MIEKGIEQKYASTFYNVECIFQRLGNKKKCRPYG